MKAGLEAQRILGLYRRLILLGRIRLPLEESRRLVGPDCAYHLYFRHRAPGKRVLPLRNRTRAASRGTGRTRSSP